MPLSRILPKRSSIISTTTPLTRFPGPDNLRMGYAPNPAREGHKMTDFPAILVVIACTLAALVVIVFGLGRLSHGWWPR